jgi:hypothetical protein
MGSPTATPAFGLTATIVVTSPVTRPKSATRSPDGSVTTVKRWVR